MYPFTLKKAGTVPIGAKRLTIAEAKEKLALLQATISDSVMTLNEEITQKEELIKQITNAVADMYDEQRQLESLL